MKEKKKEEEGLEEGHTSLALQAVWKVHYRKSDDSTLPFFSSSFPSAEVGVFDLEFGAT